MENLSKKLARKIRSLATPGAARARTERSRLSALPRYVETTTDLPGFTCRIPDGPSFLASWEEIFDKEIYSFKPSDDSPRILDCGANVGVSCLYFCKKFPNARITAFEPEPKILAFLKHNLASGGCSQVTVIGKAVWSSETILKFQSEGADAGRIDSGAGKNLVDIPTIRLRDFLNEPLDLLKMDIEGAETEVVLDIAPCLQNVQNFFVEYHSFAARPQTLGILVQTLTDAGFRVHIHPMIVSPHPFIAINTYLGMDMQLNIFARRERAAA